MQDDIDKAIQTDEQLGFGKALVRLTDEELKHQELFRRLERMAGEQMPEGYQFMPQPNEVAGAVLSKVADWLNASLATLSTEARA